MNDEKLARLAKNLEEVLLYHSRNSNEAASLLRSLTPILRLASNHEISRVFEWDEIPGGRIFIEDGLTGYDDIEVACAEFKIEITGGETEILKNKRLAHDCNNDA